MNAQYESVLKTIGLLTSVDNSIQKDRGALISFADKLRQQKDDVSSFHQVEKDLKDYLANYDFAFGYKLISIEVKLDKISSLREKLTKMLKEVEKLETYSKINGLKQAIEDCRELSSFCTEKMGLDEVDDVSKKIDASTRILTGIWENDIKKRNQDRDVLGCLLCVLLPGIGLIIWALLNSDSNKTKE